MKTRNELIAQMNITLSKMHKMGLHKNKLAEDFIIDCKDHGLQITLIDGITCPECYQSRQSELKEEQHQYYLKRMRRDVEIKIADANIPVKFLDTCFDKFNCINEEMIKNKKVMQDYDYKQNLFLIGKTGNGKTMLAISTLMKFLEKNLENDKYGYYIKFYEISLIKIENRDIYMKMISADLLIIDEFGVSETDYKIQTLFEVIDYRYDHKLPTIFISNKTPDEIKTSITDATLSRIKENCITLKFTNDDYRIKGAINV